MDADHMFVHVAHEEIFPNAHVGPAAGHGSLDLSGLATRRRIHDEARLAGGQIDSVANGNELVMLCTGRGQLAFPKHASRVDVDGEQPIMTNVTSVTSAATIVGAFMA